MEWENPGYSNTKQLTHIWLSADSDFCVQPLKCFLNSTSRNYYDIYAKCDAVGRINTRGPNISVPTISGTVRDICGLK